MTSSTRD